MMKLWMTCFSIFEAFLVITKLKSLWEVMNFLCLNLLFILATPISRRVIAQFVLQRMGPTSSSDLQDTSNIPFGPQARHLFPICEKLHYLVRSHIDSLPTTTTMWPLRTYLVIRQKLRHTSHMC